MKILVIGDPHLKLGSRQRTTKMIDAIIEQIQQTKPDLIVCLGDVLDRFANIRQETLSQATEFFRQLQSFADTVILIGNHDRPNNAVFCTDEHPFNAVKFWEQTPHNITIIDYPKVVSIKSQTYTFVPYVPDGRFMEALSLTSGGWEKSKVIFAHQDFLGAKYGSQISTTGDSWDRKLPLVISGHIHDYQEISKNVIYAGSPLQHAFDESPIKSLLLMEVSSKSVSYERLILDVPIFWTYRISFSEIAKYIPPTLPEFSDMKLVIEGSVSELKGIHKLTKVKEWQKLGIKIQPVIQIDKTKSLLPQISWNKKKAFIDILRESLDGSPDLLQLI